MNIRKFEATSFEAALNRVKAELGPDALILASEEKRRGWFQKPLVEITAAFEPPVEKEWDENALEKIFPHRRKKPEDEHAHPTAASAVLNHKKESSTAHASPLRTTVTPESTERSLLRLGLSSETAKEFARQIIFEFPKKDREDGAFAEKIQARYIAAGVKTLGADVFKTRRSWAAVGGPGSGKTSLVVKMALALKNAQEKVVLASSDNRKIVGRHELAAYSKLIGVAFHASHLGEKKSGEISFLDTPSVSQASGEIYKEVEKNCRDCSTVIVLDASQRLEELLKTVDRLTRLAPVALAFTRLDLVSQAGVVYDVLKQTKLPLLGFSVSSSFTQAFRFFEPASLARFIVQRASFADTQQSVIESAVMGSREAVI